MGSKNTCKTIAKICANVLLYVFIALCLFGVIVTITAKKDPDGTATIFGKQLRFVQSSSMEKCDLTDVSDFKIKDIPVKSLIFIDVVPEDANKAEDWYADLKVGDVLTFKYVYVTQETITHRITSIEKKPTGGYIIELEGDNKNADASTLKQTIDTSLTDSPNYVIGKVTGKSYLLGLLVYALKTPAGLICIVILPATVILILELLHIIRIVNADKDKAIKNKQQLEIEELKRKLKELEEEKLAKTD